MSDRQSKLRYGEYLRRQIQENEERRRRQKMKEVEQLYGVEKTQKNSRPVTETTQSKNSTGGFPQYPSRPSTASVESLHGEVRGIRRQLLKQGRVLSADLRKVRRVIQEVREESQELRRKISIMKNIQHEMQEDFYRISYKQANKPLKRPSGRSKHRMKDFMVDFEASEIDDYQIGATQRYFEAGSVKPKSPSIRNLPEEQPAVTKRRLPQPTFQTSSELSHPHSRLKQAEPSDLIYSSQHN